MNVLVRTGILFLASAFCLFAAEERRYAKGQTSTIVQNSRSTEELIDDLASDDCATQQAAEATLAARGRSIVPEVMQSIKSGTDIEQFYGLFEKMGPDAEAALPKLLSLLGDKKSVFGAILTMERIKHGSFTAIPKKLRGKAAAALYDAAIDPKAAVIDPNATEMLRAYYVEFLYKLGDVATPHVLKLLRSDKPEYRAMTAVSVNLTFYYDDAVEKELVKMLGADDDLSARRSAARALGTSRILSKEAKVALLDVIRNLPPPDPQYPVAYDEKKARRNYELRQLSDAAARSLGTAGPSIIDYLIPMLSPMNAPKRSTALLALESIGSPAVPRLVELLAHEDAAVATTASVALNRIGGPSVAALSKALASRNEQIIVHAASALWWIGAGAKKAVPALLEVAGSEDRSDIERLAAARAALKIDGEGSRDTKAILSTIPVLICTLDQGRFQHQAWAAETLHGVGPAAREALPMLRRRLALPGKNVDTGGFVADYVKREAVQAIDAIEAGFPDKPTADP